MNASSVDIKAMLEDYGDSSGFDEDIYFYGDDLNVFLNTEPTTPRNCVTIYDTEGFPPYLSLAGETGYEYPSVQIRIRNSDQIKAWSLIEKIKNSLHGRHQETWNGTLYSRIACSSGPALLDRDENGNWHFIINLELQRRPA